MVLRARSSSPHVRDAAASLAVTMLARNVLFEHDASEPVAWLDALPSIKRSPEAKAPDGTSLVDELSCVASFLDECAARCLKTPYHYLESVLDLCYNPDPGLQAKESNLRSRPPQFAPSPLLGTVFEQFAAKQNKQLLSAPENVAIVTYLRKLLSSLIGKQPDVACTVRVLEAFRALICQTRIPADAPSMALGLARELRFVNHIISQLGEQDRGSVDDQQTQSNRDAIASFLDAVESSDAGE